MASLRNLVFIIVILVNGHFRLSKAYNKYKKSFQRPCYEEDKAKELEFCSDPNGDCHLPDRVLESEKPLSEVQLIRVDGFKKGHVQEVDLGEETNYTLITKALKPLTFELPNFLTHEECNHIIDLAKDSGLQTSIAGFNNSVYEGDLEEELANVTTDIPPEKFEFATDFFLWDKNNDGVIDTEEIKYFIARNKLLFMSEEEFVSMFKKLQFYDYKDGKIEKDVFHNLNKAKLVTYLDYMKNKHPKYRPRYSEQAWLPQNSKSDPMLRKLHERVIKLTKLPRKIVQGGEALQVVRYGPSGHYHVHYDSMPVHDGKKAQLPCCHQRGKKSNSKCRLCRFITILYYLNDVEEGGETAFIVADNTTFRHDTLTTPDVTNPRDDFNLSLNCYKANLVVAPRKGHAIMWYNHFIDEDTGLLGEVDEYSLHGGCDVIKGEKWIANNWITAPPPGREHIPSVYDVGFD